VSRPVTAGRDRCGSWTGWSVRRERVGCALQHAVAARSADPASRRSARHGPDGSPWTWWIGGSWPTGARGATARSSFVGLLHEHVCGSMRALRLSDTQSVFHGDSRPRRPACARREASHTDGWRARNLWPLPPSAPVTAARRRQGHSHWRLRILQLTTL
jgi:hypothetical protein